MATITYNRDTSKDIIPPIQILVDSQGRVLTVDGKALQIDSSASLTNPSVLIDSSDNVYTYNGNAILVEKPIQRVILSFVKEDSIKGFTIDGTYYNIDSNIELEEGEHSLSVTRRVSVTDNLEVNYNNVTTLGTSCTFTISGTTVTFTGTDTYVGTTSDTFVLSHY